LGQISSSLIEIDPQGAQQLGREALLLAQQTHQ
jgi:hypothetical protein